MVTEGMISRILVPVDFSSGSQHAWTVACRLAGTLDAELVVLHVLPHTPVDLAPRFAREELRAQECALQAEHQLGIPREAEPEQALPQVFTGPFTSERMCEFSPAGREWACLLERWAEVGRTAGCRVTATLRVGVPHREVVAAAKEEKADLVLLSTHGLGQVHRLFVGSVADQVIRLSPCPVLTVKEASASRLGT